MQCYMFVSALKYSLFFIYLFFPQLVQEVCVERRWGQKGSPWEFNLRDLFRWCELMLNDQSSGFFNPGQHVALVYADRMRTEADKSKVHILLKVSHLRLNKMLNKDLEDNITYHLELG